MYLRKTESISSSETTGVGEQAFMVEPRPGYSDEEVVASLQESGVSQIKVLAPGFISVRAEPCHLRNLEEIADIHSKAEKRPRS
jgi:hypothetical protein